jgi:FAD/FMN-containing dehydrogenase
LLQGGFGWNSRNVGVGCQNVIGIDVVLADGTLVHASDTENADLYWAARGAGPGFFGVVVRFHLKLHQRAKFIGMKLQVFRIKHLEEVLAWADRVGPSVSPKVEFQIVMNPKAAVINAHGMEIVAPVMADSWKEARELVAFMANSRVRPKASFTLPLLPMSLNFMMKAGEKTLFLSNTRWSADNMWMDTPIAPLLPAIRRIADTQPPHPSHVLWLNWNGPVQRPDMAFSQEHRTYLALYCGLGQGVDESKHIHWATKYMKALEPWSRGIQLADENLARRPAKFVSDANMARLDQVRAKYDPEGRFHPWMGRV